MLNRKHFITITLMAFGIFFGAGNLIFPPDIAQQAGHNVWQAYLGFLLTAVLLPVLGIITVVKTNGLLNLGKRVHPVFAYLLTIGILIAIGPGLAIPRTGSTSFEMALKPYLTNDNTHTLALVIYSFIYFAIVTYCCWVPNKIVQRIGKISTPALLILIVTMTIFALFKPTTTLPVAQANFQNHPIQAGFLAGYHTLDTLAGLNYGLLIMAAIQSFKLTNQQQIMKTATLTSISAGLLLAIIYACLIIIGQTGVQNVNTDVNGAQILINASTTLLNQYGTFILGLIFVLACFNTCVGLVTSISQFFHQIMPKISYHQFVLILVIWSFALSTIGLNGILKYSVPVLILLYPISITLIILTLTEPLLHHSKLSYQVTSYLVTFISIIMTIENTIAPVPIISHLLNQLPFANNQLHWILPMIISMLIFYLIDLLKTK